MSLAFITTSVADQERPAQGESVSPASLSKETALRRGSSFRGRIVSHRCGFLRVSTVEGGAQNLAGPTWSIGPSPADALCVGIHTRGLAGLAQDDWAQRCGPGDVFVIDWARPYTLRELEGFRLHVFRIPGAVLGIPEKDREFLGGVHRQSGNGVVQLLAPLLETIADSVSSYSPHVAHRLAGSVTDLLGTMLSERTVSEHADVGAADENADRLDMVRRIRSFVNQNLGDRELSPEMIAAHHHVSVRYLHKVFVSEGTTISRWIQQRRLEECRRELARLGQATSSVSAVAKRWGFVNAAHFSRSFRAAYGISPSDWHKVRSADGSAAARDEDTGVLLLAG
ncbi:helix-turn-helix domain-containing protein [Streptomyces sp. NBC_01803]|uniref:helix-turn-helix domain-containing protein n=1 Tax=Streptomyces sp. NBC_01803 TaxID=2975946 RepID=UPI002DDAFDB7|nr:helix-turn-helix domain-containing protein [Streptomyces sp. NBC_01803]WSA43631.1 helix-turn-helix domain-containing protein [Streptomyces sp. NBC_01803]